MILGVIAAPAAAQITTIARPRPQIGIVQPDGPLLIGLNSGAIVQVDDMNGAAAQVLSTGFMNGTTSVAPVIGRGINGVLVSLIPGSYPRRQVLLPSPDWQMLDSRTGTLSSFTIDPDGNALYGVSCETGTIVRYDLQAGTSAILGSKGNALGQLECPEQIAVDAAGRIYVSDKHRIVRMNDITGNGWTSFGSHGSGQGQFNYIRGLSVDKKGRIYVSDYFNNRVVRFDDMNGAGWTTRNVPQPRGIAVDTYDRLYIAQPVGNKIVRIDDMTGAGEKTFMIPRDAGYAGPNVIVPVKKTASRPVIR